MKILLLIIFLPISILASEPDDFSYLKLKAEMKDQTKIINQYVNNKISFALENANQGFNSKNKCNNEELIDHLQYVLNTTFPDIYSDLYYDNLLVENKDLYSAKRRESTVYKKLKDGIATKAIYKFAGTVVAPSLKVGDTIIGLDKLDHFLGHGFYYFNHYRKIDAGTNEEKLNKVLNFGLSQENGSWGLSGLGIKSYGDLASNYDGYTFWSDMFSPDKPYFTCQNNKLKKIRDFDITKYVKKSWNETLNCSSFVKEENSKIFDEAVKSITGGVVCPVSIKDCSEIKKMYPEKILSKLLHPRCLNGSRELTLYESTDQPEGRTMLPKLKNVNWNNFFNGVFGLKGATAITPVEEHSGAVTPKV